METKFTVHLIEITSAGPGKDFPIEKESTILGRDEAADIVIEISKISRQHAIITHTPLGYTLKIPAAIMGHL
jgi:pSer/pThr/pTyr-binding forkhead associated (FHA) protein